MRRRHQADVHAGASDAPETGLTMMYSGGLDGPSSMLRCSIRIRRTYSWTEPRCTPWESTEARPSAYCSRLVLFNDAATSHLAMLYPSISKLPQDPSPCDSHPTATSTEQGETERSIKGLLGTTAPLLSEDLTRPSTTLRKSEHAQFLASTFFKLPSSYVALDASRPWLVFWTVHSLDLMGVTLDAETKARWARLLPC